MWPFKKKEPTKEKDTYSKTLYRTYSTDGYIGILETNPMDAEYTTTHKFHVILGDGYVFKYHRRGAEIVVNRANITYVEPESLVVLAEYEY